MISTSFVPHPGLFYNFSIFFTVHMKTSLITKGMGKNDTQYKYSHTAKLLGQNFVRKANFSGVTSSSFFFFFILTMMCFIVYLLSFEVVSPYMLNYMFTCKLI